MLQKEVKTAFSLAFHLKNWSSTLQNNEMPVLTNKSEIIKEKGEALSTLDTETFSLKCKCVVLKNVPKCWSTYLFCRVYVKSNHCVFKYILFKWILKLLKCWICIYLPFIGQELKNSSENAPYRSNNLLQVWLVETKRNGKSPGYFCCLSQQAHDWCCYLPVTPQKQVLTLTHLCLSG